MTLRYTAWWHTPVISVLGRLRPEVHEIEASMSYKARSCLFFKKGGKKQIHHYLNCFLQFLNKKLHSEILSLFNLLQHLFCANNSIPKVFVKNKQQRLFKITAA
jgi:hypothetical protein